MISLVKVLLTWSPLSMWDVCFHNPPVTNKCFTKYKSKVTHPGTNLALSGLNQFFSKPTFLPLDYGFREISTTITAKTMHRIDYHFLTIQINVSIAWQSGARRWLYMVWGPASVSPEPLRGLEHHFCR